jgi:hypothetical protein
LSPSSLQELSAKEKGAGARPPPTQSTQARAPLHWQLSSARKVETPHCNARIIPVSDALCEQLRGVLGLVIRDGIDRSGPGHDDLVIGHLNAEVCLWAWHCGAKISTRNPTIAKRAPPEAGEQSGCECVVVAWLGDPSPDDPPSLPEPRLSGIQKPGRVMRSRASTWGLTKERLPKRAPLTVHEADLVIVISGVR